METLLYEQRVLAPLLVLAELPAVRDPRENGSVVVVIAGWEQRPRRVGLKDVEEIERLKGVGLLDASDELDAL